MAVHWTNPADCAGYASTNTGSANTSTNGAQVYMRHNLWPLLRQRQLLKANDRLLARRSHRKQTSRERGRYLEQVQPAPKTFREHLLGPGWGDTLKATWNRPSMGEIRTEARDAL